ncbi:MAG: SBBP repeat-containing protein [Promethearchaeota archaeon]
MNIKIKSNSKKKNIVCVFYLLLLSFTLNKVENRYLIEDSFEVIKPIVGNGDSEGQEWVSSYNEHYTYGKCLALDSDQNVIVGTSTLSGFTVVKYNNLGTKLWETNYYRLWDFFRIEDIGIDSSDNIYVAGRALGEMIGWDPIYFLIKFNQSGSLEWEQMGSEGEYSIGKTLVVDSSDRIYIGILDKKYNESDIVLMKYNNSGDINGIYRWGGNNEDYVVDLAIDSLDNIYVLGYTNETIGGNYNLVLLKYNGSGNLLWNVTWGGPNDVYGLELLLDSSEQINVLGSIVVDKKEFSFLLKYNVFGVLLWNKTFYNDKYIHFTLDSFDNFYFAQNGEYFEDMGTDIYLAMYNNTVNFQWDLLWGGELDDSFNAITTDPNDNLYLTGYTRNSMILVKNPTDKTLYSPPGIFTLNSSASYANNTVNLIWTDSRGAENYSIYTYNDYFRDINNSSNLITEGIFNNNYSISGLQDGVHFFIVTAHNRNGYTVSNCIYVIIGEQIEENENKTMEFYLLLAIFMGIGIIYVVSFTIIYRKFFLKFT